MLDEFGNSTESAYTGWPDRLYLIDGSGRVAYKSKPGPFGFKPADLEAAITKWLGDIWALIYIASITGKKGNIGLYVSKI